MKLQLKNEENTQNHKQCLHAPYQIVPSSTVLTVNKNRNCEGLQNGALETPRMWRLPGKEKQGQEEPNS